MTWAGFFKKNNSDYRRFRIEVQIQMILNTFNEDRDQFLNFMDKEELLIACKNYMNASDEMKSNAGEELRSSSYIFDAYVNYYIDKVLEYDVCVRSIPESKIIMNKIRILLSDINQATERKNPSFDLLSLRYYSLKHQMRAMNVVIHSYLIDKCIENSEEKNCCASLCCIS